MLLKFDNCRVSDGEIECLCVCSSNSCWLLATMLSSDSFNLSDSSSLLGDHLYRMDYMDFVQNHIDRNADITLSCAPVGDSQASAFRLVKINSRGRITQFSEKTKGPNKKAVQVDTSIIGLSPLDASKSPYVASMGVYAFRTHYFKAHVDSKRMQRVWIRS
ncbi:Glucose-1-phosphate adenylyltransferase large subunit 1 [Castilleja foliolosa]|uniref:Glucose-1-phosphate adenylyltransferase large subunit 1 n=2 Tax=Castilleja foliolosa TaxID=1961234 RepID=A0ABD3DWB3_9LAMI